MKIVLQILNTGTRFAANSFQRRSILLSNIVALVVFGLTLPLFFAYLFWYGWSVVTIAIPATGFLCLCTLALNRFNLSGLSRIWLCVLIPGAVMALSIYAKQLYYSSQEELDYFTFRFVILASCVFPAIFFSFRERTLLVVTSLLGFALLMAHDPLHEAFGVPYPGLTLKKSNYYFTNVVVVFTYLILMSAVGFLKYISETSEERADKLIQELNKTNEELTEKNNEIEAQNSEIMSQADNLNVSQQRLQEAYELIAEQKNLLVKQNKNLSTELVDINNNLSETNSELIKHNNELRQFSYTVSHNLRGPVASLIGLINMIDHQPPGEEQDSLIAHMKTSVQRLDNIIKDLSKIIDIRHDIFNIRQKINLENEVKEIVRGLKKDVDLYNVKIVTDFAKCPVIYSVRPMVHSILYNLISNAIKYRASTRRPEITITSDLKQNYVLEVKDNGLGIDLKRYKDSLFKLYKRFHFHTEGKGLGLYLVKLQAETLGGKVEVQSEINEATHFKVFLGQPQNVQQQVLFETSFAQIFFDANLHSIKTVWHGPVSSEQYRTAFLKCLEFVKAYHTPNYLVDLTHQGHVAREDQGWMLKEILPEAAHYGLKRIATVQPDAPDTNVAQYLKGITGSLKHLGMEQEYFLTLEEAIQWISASNEKEIAILNYD
jgi:signal transduction histidine kinase